MRNATIVQIVVILLCAVTASAVDPNLVAWYQFDEGSGLTAFDSARNHDAAIHGALWAPGKIGGALYFNGSSYASAPDHQELNITGDITIAAWVNFNAGGAERSIVSKCFDNGAYDNPYDFRSDISSQPLLTMVRANESEHEATYSDVHIPLNAWHHVAVRVENGVTDFYVDGVLTGKWWGEPPIPTPPTGNNFDLLIGARDDGNYFIGLIDDVRLYNRALSGEEIAAIPEPCTILLLGLGAVIGSNVRRKRD